MRKSILILTALFFSILLNGQILFEDEASIRGMISHTGTIGNGNGLSFADYNGDGLDDITLPSGDGVPLRFYKNIGGFFVEENLITPQITYQIRAVSWVDYDNDGHRDLYIASDTEGNRLYMNNNDGSFTNVTIASGLFEDNVSTYGISWGDINNDGCLDLYLSNRAVDSTVINYLFKNNCDGTFTEYTEQAGLLNTPALTLCASFFDYNNDGWQDLYVSNDKHYPNFLYKNNGDGTFSDVSESTKTDIIVDAMSVTIDDFNADGYFDIYITNTPNDEGTPTLGSVLLKNEEGVKFTDVSLDSGVQLDSWSWGANFLDADNDTDLDLYISASYISADGYPSYAFYNNSGDVFNQPDNVGFINNEYRSYGSATGDINNDGRVDIAVINNFDTPPNLWVNNSTTENNFISVELEGTITNKDALGSVVEISIDGVKQYRYVTNGESYLSQNSFKEYFGIGEAELVDYVKVKWLSGVEDIIYAVGANSNLKILEGNTLSLDILNSEIDFSVYSNHSSKTLSFKSNSVIKKIEIFNMIGQRVNVYDVNSKSFYSNTNTISSGVYLIKSIFENDKAVIKKILIL